jgi:hypothetical protein
MKRSLALVLLLAAVAAPAAARARDYTAPKLSFSTQDGDVLVGAPAASEVSTVAGVARDGGSGIRRVVVTYCAGSKNNGGWTCSSTLIGSGISTVRAELDCEAARCDWAALVPSEPGMYLAFAKAVDRAGNVRHEGPIEITVV